MIQKSILINLLLLLSLYHVFPETPNGQFHYINNGKRDVTLYRNNSDPQNISEDPLNTSAFYVDTDKLHDGNLLRHGVNYVLMIPNDGISKTQGKIDIILKGDVRIDRVATIGLNIDYPGVQVNIIITGDLIFTHEEGNGLIFIRHNNEEQYLPDKFYWYNMDELPGNIDKQPIYNNTNLIVLGNITRGHDGIPYNPVFELYCLWDRYRVYYKESWWVYPSASKEGCSRAGRGTLNVVCFGNKSEISFIATNHSAEGSSLWHFGTKWSSTNDLAGTQTKIDDFAYALRNYYNHPFIGFAWPYGLHEWNTTELYLWIGYLNAVNKLINGEGERNILFSDEQTTNYNSCRNPSSEKYLARNSYATISSFDVTNNPNIIACKNNPETMYISNSNDIYIKQGSVDTADVTFDKIKLDVEFTNHTAYRVLILRMMLNTENDSTDKSVLKILNLELKYKYPDKMNFITSEYYSINPIISSFYTPFANITDSDLLIDSFYVSMLDNVSSIKSIGLIEKHSGDITLNNVASTIAYSGYTSGNIPQYIYATDFNIKYVNKISNSYDRQYFTNSYYPYYIVENGSHVNIFRLKSSSQVVDYSRIAEILNNNGVPISLEFGFNLNGKRSDSISLLNPINPVISTDQNLQVKFVGEQQFYNNPFAGENINSSLSNLDLSGSITVDNLPGNSTIYSNYDFKVDVSINGIEQGTYLSTDPIDDGKGAIFNLYDISLQENINQVELTYKVPLCDPVTVSQQVTYINNIDTTPDQLLASNKQGLDLKDEAYDLEYQLWNNDIFRQTETLISPIDESVTINSFDLDSNVATISLDYLSGTESFTNNVHYIKLTGVFNESGNLNFPVKEKSYYYAIYQGTGIIVYNDDETENVIVSDLTPVQGDTQYYEVDVNSEIIRIKATFQYSDFFEEQSGPVGNTNQLGHYFENEITFKYSAIKILPNSFYNETPIVNDTEINTIVMEISQSFTTARSILDKQLLSKPVCYVVKSDILRNSVKTPTFSSRLVVPYASRESIGGEITLLLKPAITENSGEIYQTVLMKDDQFQILSSSISGTDAEKEQQIATIVSGLFDNSYETEIITPILLNENDTFEDWSYVDSGIKYYRSKWINNNGIAIKINSINYFGGEEFFDEDKIHMFVIASSKNEADNYDSVSIARHSAVLMDDDSFYIIYKPGDPLPPEITYSYKLRLLGDFKVPFGNTVTFGDGSGIEFSKINTISVDNSVHVIVRGTLIIDPTADRKILFGPSGLTENSYEEYENNGIWGGIYILPEGILTIDGAIITGAYDGIVLYENGSKSSLQNIEIKNNEIGLHLYDSYPSILDSVHITNNYLYGYKEDNMINPGYETWKSSTMTDQKKTLITGNYYIDYYDYIYTVLKGAGNE